MSKRPGLSALSGHLASKPDNSPGQLLANDAATSTDSVEAGDSGKPSGRKRAGAQADGRKGVLLRLKPEAWMQLKALAAQQTLERKELFSMQSALEEALNDWFKKHNSPPIA